MALVVADRVKETTTSVGTSTINLAGAEDNFETFVAGVGTGNTTYYAIVDKGNSEFEVGIGTVTSGTPDTLSRDTVLASSNSDALVNFSTGEKDVFCTQPADRAVYLDSSGQLVIDGTSVTATATELNYVDGVTSAIQTQLDSKLNLSGGTMTGALTLSGAPTADNHATTKIYVDELIAAGIHYHDPVRVESPDDAGSLTATYNNGTNGVGATLTNNGTQAALVIDGVTLATSDRVLIYNQTNAFENGIYTVTNTGSASTNWVLTRATDADSYGVDNQSLSEGTSVFVLEGDDGSGEVYACTTTGTITFGTTAINFSQIGRSAVITGDGGITVTGNEISANVNATVQTTGANSVSSTASRTYAVQVDGSNDLVVNVPWVDTDTDTDTTYTAGTGLTLSGTQFSVQDNYVLNSGDSIAGQLSVTSSTYPPLEVTRDAGAVTTGNYGSLKLNTITSGTPAAGLGSYAGFFVDDVGKGSVGFENDGSFHILNASDADIVTVSSTGNITVAGTVDGRDIAADGTKLDGIESGATADQTASEILTAIKTVDGSGSGLDADTLDGIQATGFLYRDVTDSNRNINLNTSATNSAGGIWLGNSADTHIFNIYGDGSKTGFLKSKWGAWDLKKIVGGNLEVDHGGTLYTVWDSFNDGSGSGLDADTVDGIQGASFLRSDATDTATGAITIDGPSLGLTVRESNTRGGFRLGGGNGSGNHRLYFQAHETAAYIDSYGNNTYNPLSIEASPLKLNASSGGDVVINQASVSYTSNDNTPIVGSTTTNRLHVNGSIQLTNNNDAIVFGRGTASFMKDEEIGFGWGGGWYMTEGTYLRVRNNKSVYSTGDARFSYFYDSNDTAWYINPASTSNTDPSGKFRQYVQIGDSASYNSNNGSWGARLNVTDNIHAKIEVGQDANAMLSHWYAHTGQTSIKIGTSTAHDVEIQRGSTTQLGAYNGYALAHNQMRSPIFYDSDNTGYYADLATRTVLNTLQVGTTSTSISRTLFAQGSNHFVEFVNTSTGSNQYAQMSLKAGNRTAYIWCANENTGASTWGGPGSLNIYSDDAMTFYTANNLYNKIDTSGNFLNMTGSVRSAIFYDYNNTGYYVDPDNGGFTLRGGSSNRVTYYTNDSGFRVNNPEGNGVTDIRLGAAWGRPGVYSSSQLELMSDSTTGIIFIIDNAEYGRLNTDYFRHNSDIRAPLFYDNDNTAYYGDFASSSVLYNLELTGAKQTYLYINPGNNYEAMVRYNGGSGTTWYVGKRVTSQVVGTESFHFYSQAASATVAGIDTSGNIFSTGSVRSPIFYDSNNTSYYADPASNSRTNTEQTNYLGLGTAANTSGSYRLNMGGSINMNNNQVNYCSQVHFNDDVRFTDDGNDSYLRFLTGDTSVGGIKVYAGSAATSLRGYIGYFDSSGWGTLTGGSWWLYTDNDHKLLCIGGNNSNNAYNSTTGIRLCFGGANGDAQDNYYIGTNLENYGGNYNKLDIRWHTGIRMGATAGYGGIRFYDSEDLGTEIMSIGKSSTNVTVTNNLSVGGKLVYGGLDINPNFDINNSGGVNISDAIQYLDIAAGNNTTYVESGMILDAPWTGVSTSNSRFGISVVEGGSIDASRAVTGQAAAYGDTWLIGNIKHGSGGVAALEEGIICDPGDSLYFKTKTSTFTIDGAGNQVSAISFSILASSFTAASDKTLKENIKPLEFSSNDLQTLNAYTYNFIADKNKKTKVGLIAQEVQDVLPDAVTTEKDKKTEETVLSLDYNAIVASLVSVINELTERVNELEVKTGIK